MKKGKLLFLLIAILSVALLLVGCDDKNKPDADTADTTQNAAADQESEKQQEEVKHEMHDYFDFVGVEPHSFTKVTQLEGEVVDYDNYNKLIALRTYDLNVKNEVVETVTVYDIEADEVIAEYSVANLYGTNEYDEHFTAKLAVNIDYPIIQVKKTSYSEDSKKAIYDYSYYFAKKDGALIRQTNKSNYERFNFANGLVAFDLGDDMVWIDRNMEIVRTVDSIAANGYNEEIYNCEYQGYLYTWDRDVVRVFSPDGKNTAKYEIAHDGYLNVHVLDDGDVLIQDVEYVDEYTALDFKINGERAVMKSYVMSLTDGAIKEVKLDFYVDSLETRYAERYGVESVEEFGMGIYYSNFSLSLAEGRDNQAYIYRFANGKLAIDPEYVVLSNDLAIEYTVKNTTPGREFDTITLINAQLYSMDVSEGGSYQTYLFDLDGKMITPITDDYEFIDNYIVTENAIYDYDMQVVYEIPNTYDLVSADQDSNRIYFARTNFETGLLEISLFDGEKKEPVIWNDGSKEVFYTMFDDGIYLTYNIENETYNLYAADDTQLVSIFAQTLDIESLFRISYTNNGCLVMEGEFNGNDFVFIIK